MQVYINRKPNEKLLQNFPEDPYSDVCILTSTRRLNLILSYLSIDSQYFQRIDPDTKQIDLKHLQEDNLIRVLRALYGEQLIVNTVPQLDQIFQIIQALQIEEYINNIKEECKHHMVVFQSLQFLQFCFKRDILVDQCLKFHMGNQLKFLQSNRNYLQLNKISIQTFQHLILSYIQSICSSHNCGIQSLLNHACVLVINRVMQNYFNRNNIKVSNYFRQNSIYQQMEVIWNKFHHVITYREEQKYFNQTNTFDIKNYHQIDQNDYINTYGMDMVGKSMGNLNQAKPIGNYNQGIKRNKSKDTSSMNMIQQENQTKYEQQKKQKHQQQKRQKNKQQKKQKRIIQLQNQLKQKDQMISQLENQINLVRQRLQASNILKKKTKKPHKSIKTKLQTTSGLLNIPQVLAQQQFIQPKQIQQSICFLPNVNKKNRKNYQQQEDFTVSSVFQPAFNGGFRKIPEIKQIRTMKKVTNNQKNTNLQRNRFLPK